MNTKTFAQQSRTSLIDGVSKKLLYWGFDTTGEVLEQPESISGGYKFRGEVFDDPNVPKLWQSLKRAIRDKGIEVIVEEAAYTWFNRIMAIRILSKNNYDLPQLEYAEGLKNTPIILQKARQGQYSFLNEAEKIRLKQVIGDYNKENEAFALLIVGYCHSHNTLNKVFGKLDDYTELLLPDNMLQEQGFLHLLNTTDAISDNEYQEVELIGWLYQFYISERKDEVFASFKKRKKAEAKDIPAATQIFTPNWIVKYMVENTAGKIWLDHKPDSSLKNQMKYLVSNENDSSTTERTENKSLINSVEDLTLLDPACGSGHILVEGFDLLYQMYKEEYYTPEEAIECIFSKNLFGLDIDNRASQLATFAVMLKAAKIYPDVWNKNWKLNIYAMPEADSFSHQEVVDFLGEDGKEYADELEKALKLMQQAKNLGSVMQFELSKEGVTFISRRYQNLKEDDYLDINLKTILRKADSFVPVLLAFTIQYKAVVANPPYMGQKSMNTKLKDYVNSHYPVTKSDLMTIFMEVIPSLTADDSRFALINLPSWLFLSSFEKIRKYYINNFSFDSLLHMGRGIFGIDFGSVAFTMKKTKNKGAIGSYFKLHERNFQHIYYEDIDKLFLYSNNKEAYKYDFSKYRGEEGITEIPKESTTKGLKLFYPNIPQTNFSKIPGSPIAYWVSDKVIKNYIKSNSLENIAKPRQGMATTNNNLFVKNWSEVDVKKIGFNLTSREASKKSQKKWFPYNKGGETRKWYGIPGNVVNYKNDGKVVCDYIDNTPGVNVKSNGRVINRDFYFKEGITWSKISSKGLAFRYVPKGFVFDVAGTSIFFENKKKLMYLFSLLNSKVITSLLSAISPTINFEVGQINKTPILTDYSNFPKIKLLTESSVSISKNDWDSHETSWDFKKSPLINEEISIIKAYQNWQEHVTGEFFQLHTNEMELNRIFIEIYGLQKELNPEVALKDITILQDELNKKDLEALEPTFRELGAAAITLPIDKSEVMQQFISYSIGLFMGRYRLDKPGLNIAHPNPAKQELESYTYNKGEVIIDDDAIIPLMGTKANFKDDALYQIQGLLDTIWGQDTRTENLNFLQDCLDKDLEQYLVKDFWKFHCSMYKKKPIYWLFSSKKGAFQVLTYMHRMNAFTVEKIRAKYLMPHLKYLEAEIDSLSKNESSLSTQQARTLDKMRKDLQECQDYDLVLKDVADNQITFDLDDGVTENYKLFEGVVAKIK